MKTPPPIMRCICGELVTVEHLEIADKLPGGSWSLLLLHPCGTELIKRVSPKDFEKLVNRWTDFQLKAQHSYDTEEVGKAVQGFRIDLDAVETVADIELLWNDQERHAPWSVPRELVA